MSGNTGSNLESTIGQADQNAAIIISFLAAWHRRDVEGILAHFYPDCEYFDQSFTGHVHGHQALGDYLRYFFKTIADHQVTLIRTISAGDTVAFSWHCSGRRWSSPNGSAAFTTQGISMAKLRSGRISRLQDNWDVTSYLQQVGALD